MTIFSHKDAKNMTVPFLLAQEKSDVKKNENDFDF